MSTAPPEPVIPLRAGHSEDWQGSWALNAVARYSVSELGQPMRPLQKAGVLLSASIKRFSIGIVRRVMGSISEFGWKFSIQ